MPGGGGVLQLLRVRVCAHAGHAFVCACVRASARVTHAGGGHMVFRVFQARGVRVGGDWSVCVCSGC